MRIIEKLSIENNLSNSKIISILVEEALSTRGIFNKKVGMITQTYQMNKDDLQNRYDNSLGFKDNEKLTNNIKVENHKNPGNKNLLKHTNELSFDLQTYKKFLSFLKFQEMIDEYHK